MISDSVTAIPVNFTRIEINNTSCPFCYQNDLLLEVSYGYK